MVILRLRANHYRDGGVRQYGQHPNGNANPGADDADAEKPDAAP